MHTYVHVSLIFVKIPSPVDGDMSVIVSSAAVNMEMPISLGDRVCSL